MVNLSGKINKGFTLIELMIVIGIVAMLSSIGFTTYTSVQEDARNSKRKSDMKELKIALEQYKFKNGNRYPSTCTSGAATCTSSFNWRGNCASYDGTDEIYDDNYVPGLAPDYIPQLPHDPREDKVNPTTGCAAGSSCYLYRSNGTDYKLLAHCTPEDTWTSAEPLYDPSRTTWAWQIHSSTTSSTW